MLASIPAEFQDEGRQLARLLLDALAKAANDLASTDVAKLSSAERRRWAVQSIRMARLLATAFPQEVPASDDGSRKPSRRKTRTSGELGEESGETQSGQELETRNGKSETPSSPHPNFPLPTPSLPISPPENPLRRSTDGGIGRMETGRRAARIKDGA